MSQVKISCWRRDGSLIQLSDILAVIPANNLHWTVLYFYGVGIAPEGLSMSDFEKLASSNEQGFKMSWTALCEFAAGLEQTYDCVIVGAMSMENINSHDIKHDLYESCDVAIVCFDCYDWTIFVSKSQSWRKEIGKLRKLK